MPVLRDRGTLASDLLQHFKWQHIRTQTSQKASTDVEDAHGFARFGRKDINHGEPEQTRPAASVPLVRRARLEGAPHPVANQSQASWLVAAPYGKVGCDAIDGNWAAQWPGAVGDPRLRRGRPQSGHPRDERLGCRRAGLVAQPQARVQLADGARDTIARAASGQERERLWDQFRALDENLDGYARRRSTETAVVVLELRTKTSY